MARKTDLVASRSRNRICIVHIRDFEMSRIEMDVLWHWLFLDVTIRRREEATGRCSICACVNFWWGWANVTMRLHFRIFYAVSLLAGLRTPTTPLLLEKPNTSRSDVVENVHQTRYNWHRDSSCSVHCFLFFCWTPPMTARQDVNVAFMRFRRRTSTFETRRYMSFSLTIIGQALTVYLQKIPGPSLPCTKIKLLYITHTRHYLYIPTYIYRCTFSLLFLLLSIRVMLWNKV